MLVDSGGMETLVVFFPPFCYILVDFVVCRLLVLALVVGNQSINDGLVETTIRFKIADNMYTTASDKTLSGNINICLFIDMIDTGRTVAVAKSCHYNFLLLVICVVFCVVVVELKKRSC